MSYAIMLDKDSETVTAKVKRLYEDYPDVFASAGFSPISSRITMRRMTSSAIL